MATYDLAYPGAAIDAILNTAYYLQEAGFIFRGSASDYAGTPSKREWVIAPAGFSGYGLSSAVPQGSIGICLYNGTAWVGKVINVLTLDSAPTRNSQNGVTSGGVAATLDEIAGGIMATFASLLFDDETAAADLSTKLSYAVKFSVSDVYQTVTHLNILAATTSKAGLMSAEDKAKVDSFLTNLRSLTFADTTASADQGTQITETLKATIGGVQEVIDSITLLAATSSKAGLLSASDKAYIDALPATLTNLSNSISGALALMQSMMGYYVCDTAAGTAAKTVAATGYSLTNGGCIRIKMTNANTADNVTLNINSTGAKALYYDGAQASATNSWEAGEVLEVYYDGTQYQCASGGGGKFASGQKVKEVGITDQVTENSTELPTSGSVYNALYGDFIKTYVATIGGFWYNGSSTASDKYSYTTPISLNKGEVLTIETAGRGFDVLTKVESGNYSRLMTVSSGSDDTLQTFTYVATDDIDVIVTTKNSPVPSISVNTGKFMQAKNVEYSSQTDPNITNVDEALTALEAKWGGDKEYVADKNGFYNNGTLTNSQTYKYTSIISMKKGDLLTVETAGQGFDVLTKEENGVYSRLLNVSSGSDNTLQTFTYVANGDINVVVTTKNSPTPSIVLTSQGELNAEAIPYDNSGSLIEERNVQGAIDQLSEEIYGQITRVVAVQGGFYTNGTYHSSANYSVSGKVHLDVGNTIVVVTAGNGFDVLTNATTEGSYKTLMNVPANPGFDNIPVEYSYTADEAIDVIVTTKNSPTPQAYKQVKRLQGLGGELAAFDMLNQNPVWQRREFVSCFHLDCGRKYFSPANIKLLIDYLSDAKVDVMELHFSEDEGFRFALDDMTVNANGTTYDLSVCLGEGVDRLGRGDGSGKYLTQTQMTDIIAYAKTKNVEIAPSFDMPGHMGCILKDFPQFKYDTYALNFMNAEAVNFAFALAEKYAKYFAAQGCKIYNICADEVGSFATMHQNGNIVFFARFVNELIRLVSSYGFIPQIFNDSIYYGNNPMPIINRYVDVLYYYEGSSGNPFASANDIYKNGYDFMINSSNTIYYILGKGSVNVQTMRGFDPHNFKGGSVIAHPHGSMFCVWADIGDADGQDDGDALVARLEPLIEAYGEALTSHMCDNDRPASPNAGDTFFDKKLKQPIWYNGTEWVDANGYPLPCG